MKNQKCEFRENKVAIVGTGMVGSSFAYAAMLKGIASQLILIDASDAREEGEVMDLSHGLLGTETGSIRAGDFKDAGEADVVVITAGAAQKPGETRLDLTAKNIKILKSIIKKMGRLRQDAVVIIVSNPVDILTHVAKKTIKLPENQIFGSGTSLDTARLRYNISQRLGVNLHNVHGYVMGEHGDSEFVAWNTVNVSTRQATELFTTKQRAKIEENTRKAAYKIIQAKKATYYGIGSVLTDIAEAVLKNQNLILPVSTEPGSAYGIIGISLGVPAVIGRCGVQKVWPIKLTAGEKAKLKKSATLLKKIYKSAA